MTVVNITLSDDEIVLARQQATKQGYQRVEDYLRGVVAERLHEDDETVDYGAPDHLRVTSKEQLTALILEGMQSPRREITQADFDKVRQEIIERHRQARAQ